MARPPRVQFEGALYHVVIRANNRQPLFRDARDRRHYLDLLSRYQGRFGFRIYCYLLASRQLHLLMETPKGNVSKIMQCLGTSYTAYFNRRHKRHGTLFEGRYQSHLIDNERYLPEVTRYIHRSHFQPRLNPSKKRHYPWSSYRVYLGIKPSDLVETVPVLARFGETLKKQRKQYREFVESNDLAGKAGQNIPLAEGLTNFTGAVYARKQVDNEEMSLASAERILREVSLSLSLSPSEMSDLRESRRRALARHVAMYLIRQQTSLPLRSIGALLGVKAPAVALGISKVEQLLKRDDFSKKIKLLMENNTFSTPGTAGQQGPVPRGFPSGSAVA